jgi:hypothetical protein
MIDLPELGPEVAIDDVAGACRNRTYQPPCEGLNSFEDCAGHQTRTLP